MLAKKYQAGMLPGNRLHLSEGPIDLVIWADGEPEAVAEAYRAAEQRFDGLLVELVAELSLLRTPLGDGVSGASRPDRAAHGGGLLAASRRVHHADGRRCGCCGGGCSRSDDSGRAAHEGLCERWRRHRDPPDARHVACHRRGSFARESRAGGRGADRLRHASSRHRHQRPARTLLLARHRGCRHGSCPRCPFRRRCRDADRQRGQHRRPGHRPTPGARSRSRQRSRRSSCGCRRRPARRPLRSPPLSTLALPAPKPCAAPA